MAFFADLGFETAWQHDGLAGLRFGGAYFMLQDINISLGRRTRCTSSRSTTWTVFWAEIDALDLPAKYPGVRIEAAD